MLSRWIKMFSDRSMLVWPTTLLRKHYSFALEWEKNYKNENTELLKNDSHFLTGVKWGGMLNLYSPFYKHYIPSVNNIKKKTVLLSNPFNGRNAHFNKIIPSFFYLI